MNYLRTNFIIKFVISNTNVREIIPYRNGYYLSQICLSQGNGYILYTGIDR